MWRYQRIVKTQSFLLSGQMVVIHGIMSNKEKFEEEEMLEVQKSYQAMLHVLRGEKDFVEAAMKNLSKLPIQKQIECIVTAIAENAFNDKKIIKDNQ